MWTVEFTCRCKSSRPKRVKEVGNGQFQMNSYYEQSQPLGNVGYDFLHQTEAVTPNSDKLTSGIPLTSVPDKLQSQLYQCSSLVINLRYDSWKSYALS